MNRSSFETAAGPVDWLVPQWPAPAHVRAVCTTRQGGVSAPPYNTLNLGTHVGDDAACVAANRAQLVSSTGVPIVFMDQVHGNTILELSADTPQGLQADGCFTTQPQLACCVMVADCLPILLCDSRGERVAAVHAGWRGLLGEERSGAWHGVLEAVSRHFLPNSRMDTAQNAPEIIAWLGPCIGPQAFEVGAEVRAAFVAADARAAQCFRPYAPAPGADKWLADLQALARQRLHRLGITAIYGNDGTDAWCTVQQSARFFSHRRDRVSGRQAACIWLD
ncbi:peptidoglycan editing factor PgeF [Rhodoferax aquaticus]|uniref:Purine nucleoside phosphorylase n=1 Tax=Rhodoferax aquaticus TaxID=2527691 RepID=A0A515EN73_9BURK|nr:peptidoglycan editing factor PgeF [Rhodoferax aquaticus]QDL54092.1 peptidoglycan editing factor PgeF [Rhodoferax aquaticus]